MTDDALRTLFHPFEAGLLEPPGRRALFLGARAGFRLPRSMDLDLLAVQGFRPDVLALEKAGIAVKPRAEGSDYDLALVLLGRHRGQNEAWLREAFERHGRDPGDIEVVPFAPCEDPEEEPEEE
jgi:16S rRNA (guanine1207-N2)-methyltransferase